MSNSLKTLGYGFLCLCLCLAVFGCFSALVSASCFREPKKKLVGIGEDKKEDRKERNRDFYPNQCFSLPANTFLYDQ